MKKILFIAIMAMTVGTASAQSFLDGLKKLGTEAAKSAATSAVTNATGSSTAGSLVGGLLNSLLGTSAVNDNSLVGTWSYTQPAFVFESENMLTNFASGALAKTLQTKVQTGLDKVGFTAGKVVLTLNEDKSGSIAVVGKAIPLHWSVEGTDLTITLGSSYIPSLSKSFTLNVNMEGGNLQIATKTDKLMNLVTSVCEKAAASSTSLGTIATMTKSVKGMYMGLQFAK